MQGSTLVSQVLNQHRKHVQKRRRILHNVFESPIKLYPHFRYKQPLILYLLERMQHHQIRLLPSPKLDQDNIRHLIPLHDFQKIWQRLQTSKIQSLSQITTQNNTIKSYTDWSTSITYASIRNRFTNVEILPEFYKCLLTTFATNDLNQELDKDTEYPLSYETPYPEVFREVVPLTPENMHVYTDGSLKDKCMGSAAIFTDGNTEIQIILGKLENVNQSSTKSELLAINLALQAAHCEQSLTIYTDSNSSIKAIQSFCDPETSIRAKLKLSNASILNRIHHLMEKRKNTLTEFKWIKGHSGIHFNEVADKYANKARELANPTAFFNIVDPLISQHTFHKQVLMDNFIPIVLQKHFEQQNMFQIQSRIIETYKILWPHSVATPDIPSIMNIVKAGRDEQNRLDGKANYEHAWRVNLILNKMYTLEQMAKMSDTVDTTCRRCKREAETTLHILTCQSTRSQADMLNTKMREILTYRLGSANSSQLLVKQPLTISGVVTKFISIIDFNNHAFLTNPVALGFVTHDFYNDISIILPQMKPSTIKRLSILAIESWLTVIYKYIWIKRNDETFLPAKHERFDGEYIHLQRRQAKLRPFKNIDAVHSTANSQSTTQGNTNNSTIASLSATPILQNQQPYRKPNKRARTSIVIRSKYFLPQGSKLIVRTQQTVEPQSTSTHSQDPNNDEFLLEAKYREEQRKIPRQIFRPKVPPRRKPADNPTTQTRIIPQTSEASALQNCKRKLSDSNQPDTVIPPYSYPNSTEKEPPDKRQKFADNDPDVNDVL